MEWPARFKPGDKVMCIEMLDHFKAGDIFTVEGDLEQSPHSWTIGPQGYFINHPNTYPHFVLVNEKPRPRYKNWEYA